MKAHIAIVDPNKVLASITLTMTVERWQDLRKAMDDQPNHGAAQQLRSAVDELVDRISRRLDHEAEGSAPSSSGDYTKPASDYNSTAGLIGNSTADATETKEHADA